MRISHKALRARNAVLIANSAPQLVGRDLRGVVGSDVLGHTAGEPHVGHRLNAPEAVDATSDPDRQAFTRKIVCQGRLPQLSARCGFAPRRSHSSRHGCDAEASGGCKIHRSVTGGPRCLSLSVFSSSRRDINTTIWRSGTTVCTASNLFFGITKAPLPAQFVTKLGQKKPGQAQPIATRFWPSLQAGASTTVTRGRPDNSHG